MVDNIGYETKSFDFSLLLKNNNIFDDNNMITSFENEQEKKFFFLYGKQPIIDDSIYNKIFDIKTSKETVSKDTKVAKNTKNSKKKKEGKHSKEAKKRGRNPKESGKHNKFSDDNIRRKIKRILINELQEFINNKINDFYDKNIGQGFFKKKLLPMSQKQISDASSLFNKEFLNKSLKDIFSENISTRNKILPLNFNKLVIEKLINEQEETKRVYFQNLFSLTFIQCLRHFRGEDRINELSGLNGIDKIQEKYNFNDDYFETLTFYFFNYENITNNMRIKKN
jgi:hypothetical protein